MLYLNIVIMQYHNTIICGSFSNHTLRVKQVATNILSGPKCVYIRLHCVHEKTAP